MKCSVALLLLLLADFRELVDGHVQGLTAYWLFFQFSHIRTAFFFFFNDTPPPEISPLPLPDALPIPPNARAPRGSTDWARRSSARPSAPISAAGSMPTTVRAA